MCINSCIARHIHRIKINYLQKTPQLFELGVMVHACNLSAWEAEEGAWLPSKLACYTARHCHPPSKKIKLKPEKSTHGSSYF